MKGIVFNLLEEAVTAGDGEEAWDDLLDRSGVVGAYTSLGSYPDEELFALVGARSQQTGRAAADVVRGLGEAMIPSFAQRWPELFDSHPDARSFALTLNAIIHPEVRKLYPGADVPDFTYDESDPHVLVMGYRSSRKLCALAEGLLRGAAVHYDQRAEIAQPECMLHGDDACRLEISFTPAS